MRATGEARIDEAHRKELLRFLLVKTAAVRCGVKPAELLRVRNCYETRNEQGFRFCLYRRDVYFSLGLDYVELKVEDKSSLVLFYNRETLARTLGERANRYWLSRLGYSPEGDVDSSLDELQRRFSLAENPKDYPHEVGVFVGYPLKDVVGFVKHLPATPNHSGPWRIYGSVRESVRRMTVFKAVESFAESVFSQTEDLSTFFKALWSLQIWGTASPGGQGFRV